MAGIMQIMVANKPVSTTSYVTSGLKLYYNPATSYSGSGTTLTDLSGNGFDGVLTGSPTYSTNYFTLNGSTQWFFSGDVSSAKGTSNSHTVEVWIKPTAQSSVWSDRSNNSTSTAGGPYRASGGEIYSAGPFYLANTMLWNGAATRTGGGTTPLNNWYQLVRSYNGTSVTGYLNAVAATPTSIVWQPPTPWYIGFGSALDTNFFATGAAFTGDYGIVRVYNRALSGSEVLQNFNANKGVYGL